MENGGPEGPQKDGMDWESLANDLISDYDIGLGRTLYGESTSRSSWDPGEVRGGKTTRP